MLRATCILGAPFPEVLVVYISGVGLQSSSKADNFHFGPS